MANFPDNPFEQSDSNSSFYSGYTCYKCGKWISPNIFHTCSVPLTYPSPQVAEGWPGMITDVTMYSDFKKLFKRDTLARFRKMFIGRLEEIERDMPDLDAVMFGIDSIQDVFDDVAKEFHDDSSL
jgi:hypothetical protein